MEERASEPRSSSSLTTALLVGGLAMAAFYGYDFFFGDHPTQTPEQQQAAAAAQREADDIAARRAAREGRRRVVTLRTDLFEATLDNLGGGLTGFRVLGERFHDESGQPIELVTTEAEDYRPLRIELPGAEIPADAVWELEQESDTSARLTWEGEGVEVARRIEAGSGPYQLWQTVRVRNTGSAPRRLRLRVGAYHYVRRALESGGMFSARSPFISQGLCRHDEDVTRKTHDELRDETHGYGGDVAFVGVENTYFAQMLAPGAGPDGAIEPAERCGLWATDRGGSVGEPDGSLFEARLIYPVIELAPGEEHVWRTLAYVGPKEWGALETAGHSLPEVVNLGTFAVIARVFASLLSMIHGWVGNWGLAIILLTFMVRLALFPLMNRNFRMTARLRQLKPEMDEINARFADDPEKRAAAMMEFNRKHGMMQQQLSGCLPILLQMPVFFALYTSLSTNIELYHAPFALWWTDLSAPDPFFVLPLAYAGLMYVQQRITPNPSMDPQQAKIMLYMMPIMLGVFTLFLPAGLCLYMLTTMVLSIGQQQYFLWRQANEPKPLAGTVSASSSDASASGNKTEARPGRASRG